MFFKLPWKIVRREINETPADKKLEQIRQILFPSMELHKAKDLTYYVDYAIDSNLDASLSDLQEGQNDEVTRNTINQCIKKLTEVRNLLQVSDEDLIKSSYIIVDMREGSVNPEEIIPLEDEITLDNDKDMM